MNDKDLDSAMTDRQQLHREGYALLRQAVPSGWLDELRSAFDAGVKPSGQWPVPRVLGSHRPQAGEPPFDFNDESRSVQLAGAAGDILVFNVDLIHAGSRNLTGRRRGSILISYFAEALYASYLQTPSLRGIRLDASEHFKPVDCSDSLTSGA